MSPLPAPFPPAQLVEIKPIVGQQRGIQVAHDGQGGVGLHMVRPADSLAVATDHDARHGLITRSVSYLDPDERVELARELVRGLLYVRLEVRRD